MESRKDDVMAHGILGSFCAMILRRLALLSPTFRACTKYLHMYSPSIARLYSLSKVSSRPTGGA